MSAAAQIEVASPRTWEALEASSQWRRLSEQQKAWVVAFIVNGGDPVAATTFAYHCSSPKNAACLSYEIRKHEAVVDALNFWTGKSERDRLLEKAQENLRKSEPGSVAASKFLAMCIQLTGLTEPAAQAPDEPSSTAVEPPVCKVGDIVLVDGVKHRVTAIDANGRPTDGDPL